MAITWGSWSSNNRLQCGIELIMSPSTVTSATTSVTITTNVYLRSRYASNETTSSTTWWITGSVTNSSGSTDWNVGDMGTKLMGSTSQTVTLQYGSTQSRTGSGRIHSYYAYPGTEATTSQTITIPARPYTAPSAPSAASATRVSDTQQNVAWTRNASAAAPVTDQYIDRWDNVTNAYAQVGTIGTDYTTNGSQSFSNTNTVADRQYRYRIRSRNSAGYSGYAYTSYIKTTPRAPTGQSAAKDASGNIIVSWTGTADIGENTEVWHAANGVWDASPLATVTDATLSYTHVAPNNTQTHKYRLRTLVTNPSLSSAYSGETATIQLLAPPNAPTNLAPDGIPQDATQDITVSWQHNPVDTTPQTYRENRYRVDGGAWVAPGRFATSSQSRVWTAGTFTNGTTVEWQTRTWGAATTGGSLGNGDSPWSASAIMVMSSPPSATINQPDGTNYPSSSLVVTWGYFDAEGTTQSQWSVKLYDVNNNLLETLSESNNATTVTMGTALQDGATYTVTVQVRDSAGSWSAIDTVTFPVVYAKPPVPQAVPSWDEEGGQVGIEALVGSAGAGEVEAVYLRVWRSTDSGASYRLVASNVVPGSTVTDPIPPLNSTVTYMVEAVSASPSVSSSAPVDVFTDSRTYNRVWLNVGPGFSVARFLSPECSVKVSADKAVEFVQYDDRPKPVEYSSIHRDRIISVSGIIVRDNDEPQIATSSYDELEDAILNYSAPMCLRDLRGHRWFVGAYAPDWDGPHKKFQAIAFTAREVDWSEPTVDVV